MVICLTTCYFSWGVSFDHCTDFQMSYSLTKKAHGRCTLLRAQTGGRGDICNITAFYHKKAPMFTVSQPTTGYCTPTNPPSTSLIQFSVCISQACLASHKWTSTSVLTFQKKDSKVHAMSFTGKPSHVEKLIRNFQKLPQ